MKCYGKINLKGTNIDMIDKEYMVFIDYIEVLYKGEKLKLNISNLTSIYRSNVVMFGNSNLYYIDDENNEILVTKEIIENSTISNIYVKLFDKEDEDFFIGLPNIINVSIHYLKFIDENKEIYFKNSLLEYDKPLEVNDRGHIKILNLRDVLNFPGIKNNMVLLLSGTKFTNDKNKEVIFGEYYGALCGGSSEGLVLEESLEVLFNISGIDIKLISYTNNHIILCQDEVKYIADLVIGTEGCSEPSEHINFNTLEVYHVDKHPIDDKHNKKMNIKYIDDIYNSGDAKLELLYSVINDINKISRYDNNLLFSPIMVQDLVNHIIIEGYDYIPPIIEIESCFVETKYRNQGLFTQAMNEIINTYEDSIILTSAYVDTREYKEEPKEYDPILIPLSEMLKRKFNLKDINKYIGQEYSIVLALGTGERSKKIIDDILEKINKM